MGAAAARAPVYVAVLVAGLAFGVNLRYNGFVAPFTDPSGYVSAGARWLSGDLQRPVAFQFQPRFPNPDTMGSPLAYRPGAIKGTDVQEYPLGLPVFIAASMAVMGEWGAYVVGPLFAALLAWCTYGLGTVLAGPWAGVIAAILVSASPVTIRHSVYVSSDVPSAAFWALAWLMSLAPRTGAAAAAGAAVTSAVMIRPNTAPLALVIGVLVLMGGAPATPSPAGWRWRRAAVFAGLAALGPALVLWSNTVLYGGPLEAGYKGAAEFFRWAHVGPNLRLYPSWIVEVHSWAAFTGLAVLPAALWKARASALSQSAATVALAAAAMATLNLALILPYLNFAQWTYLRFLLPAMTALFVLLGGAVVWAARWLSGWARPLAALAALPAALVVWQGLPQVRLAFNEYQATRSVLLMGHYLRAALPPDVVILSFMHSGPAAYYTGRPIVRLDIVQPDLDAVIAELQHQGFRPMLLIDEVIESPHMARIFPQSAFNRLDWPPRAAFSAFGSIWLMDPADRARHQAGEKYPTDILR